MLKPSEHFQGPLPWNRSTKRLAREYVCLLCCCMDQLPHLVLMLCLSLVGTDKVKSHLDQNRLISPWGNIYICIARKEVIGTPEEKDDLPIKLQSEVVLRVQPIYI